MGDEYTERSFAAIYDFIENPEGGSADAAMDALSEIRSLYDDLRASRDREIAEAYEAGMASMRDDKRESRIRREAAEAERERMAQRFDEVAKHHSEKRLERQAAGYAANIIRAKTLREALDMEMVQSLTPPRTETEPEVCEWGRASGHHWETSCGRQISTDHPYMDGDECECGSPIRIVEDSNA